MMNSSDSTRCPLVSDSESSTIGKELHRFASELFPLHRAITGAGLRATLKAISKRIPLETRQVPTGEPVLDWVVPNEWRILDAFVQHPNGCKVIDIQKSNLHLVSYSVAVDQQMSWAELTPHLHTLPEHPAWIPYRSAHFQTRWGFCLSHEQWQGLAAENLSQPLRVFIDAEQFPGYLNYGEFYLPGQRSDEFLISTHICHPSLANDNLSGIVVATELARRLALQPQLPISFRFLFLPATIGAITWLARNSSELKRVRGGLVLSNLGDAGLFTYKASRQQSALIDRIAALVLRRDTQDFHLRNFTPWGYDERQYCSPGFNLPVGRLTRTPEGEFPQYHTSADDLDFIRAESLAESLRLIASIVNEFSRSVESQQDETGGINPLAGLSNTAACEATSAIGELSSKQPSNLKRVKQRTGQNAAVTPGAFYINTRPFGEPRLDQYGLYRGYGEEQDLVLKQAVMWMINLSDGNNCFADIAGISGLDPVVLNVAAQKLVSCGLLRETG